MDDRVAGVVEAANELSSFLCTRDALDLTRRDAADVIICCGCALLDNARVAAELLAAGVAQVCVITGGIGHSTELLYHAIARVPELSDIPCEGRPEAAILHDVMLRMGVEPGRLIVEDASRSCGENAKLTVRLLRERHPRARKLLVIQDPSMQLRTRASFQKWLTAEDAGGEAYQLLDFAPFIPMLRIAEPVAPADGPIPEGVVPGAESELLASLAWAEPAAGRAAYSTWTLARFLSLLLGEIPRLRPAGYGPEGRGFISRVDVPAFVEASWSVLSAALPSLAGR